MLVATLYDRDGTRQGKAEPMSDTETDKEGKEERQDRMVRRKEKKRREKIEDLCQRGF
jgi:hypothetical protein